ncbi:MAG TPA: antibiotic biosynthesis monooxygenase [Stellaceae bacterium]|nr:antibiotic biosynthesis monooxygenase [Stellaceae bacterium]
MIVREWRGWASREHAAAYPEHFRTVVLPELRALAGFVGATLARRDDGARVEYLVLTRWRSLDAIRAFAGGDIGRAVVEPGAAAALVAFDETVRHYEAVEDLAAG